MRSPRILVGAILLIATTAAAQREALRPFTSDPVTLSADLVEASRLLAVNPDAALAMLHKLNARFPGRDEILSRLGYGMQAVGKVDSAVVFYRAALDANPLNLDAGKALGSIYYSQGHEDEARQVFDRLIDVNRNSIAAYKMVAGALRDLGHTDDAIAILERGRALTPNNASLSLDIADYCHQQGDDHRALDEYFGYLAGEPRAYRIVRERLLETIRDAGQGEGAIVKDLKQRADGGGPTGVIAADVLAARYLEKGLLENSLEMALQSDNDKLSDGSALLSLAEKAVEEADQTPRPNRGRYFDLALRALEGFTQNHKSSPEMARATFALAGVYAAYGSGENPAVPAKERAGYLQRAVEAYATVSRAYAGSDLAEKSYLERGDILLKKLKHPDEALDAYKSGSVNARRDAADFASRIAELYIGTGRTADLQNFLTALSRSRYPDLAEAGQYYAGVELAMEKKYEAAKDTLTALAEHSPASPYANDAIETAWVVEEGMQLDSHSIDDLMEARRADMVGDTATVVTRLKAIAARDTYDPLRPRALNQLGLVLFGQGQNDAALATMQRFLGDYPDDDLAPVVRRAMGRVYEIGLGDYDKALHEYEQVLMSYPQYAMLDDVRRDINRLHAAREGATYAP